MSRHRYFQTFDQADAYLGKKQDRPLAGRSTRIRRIGTHSIAIRYHDTDVVTYVKCEGRSNEVILDNGGWFSPTTKDRINSYSQARLYQEKGLWYIVDMAKGGKWFEEGNARLFTNPMVIDEQSGRPLTPRDDRADQSLEAECRAMDRRVSKYIRGFGELIKRGELPRPGGGDCWGCLMQTTATPTQADGWRRHHLPPPDGCDMLMGLDHILSHLDEKYYVPSLLLRALEEAGYRDPGFIWMVTETRKDPTFATRALRGWFKRRKNALVEAARTHHTEATTEDTVEA